MVYLGPEQGRWRCTGHLQLSAPSHATDLAHPGRPSPFACRPSEFLSFSIVHLQVAALPTGVSSDTASRACPILPCLLVVGGDIPPRAGRSATHDQGGACGCLPCRSSVLSSCCSSCLAPRSRHGWGRRQGTNPLPREGFPIPTEGYVPHMPAFHWLLSREKLFPGWR